MLAAVVAACLLAAGAAQAQTASKLVGNTGQTTNSYTDFRWHLAQAFTTGSASHGYKLTRADLRLRLTQGAQPTYTVQIYSANSSGNPDTSLGTLTTSTSLAAGWQNIQFTASGDGIDLAADTTYLVVLAATAGATQYTRWAETNSDAEDGGGAAGWSIANNSRYRSGTSWSVLGTSSFQIAVHGYEKPGPVRFASGFGPLRLEPGAAMTPVTLPAATGGGGAPYTYSLTSKPAGLAGLSFDAATRTLSGTPEAEGRWTFVYRAHDGDADTSAADAARLTFRVTVGAAFEEQQRVVKRTLAAVASRTVAGAQDMIGARLGDAVPAARLALAGRSAPFGGSGAGGPDNAIRSGEAHSRGMEAGELLGSSAFSLALGAAEGEPGFDAGALRWGVWGRGDYGAFEGRAGPDARFKGDMRTGWLGVDARAGRWVAGLAVSRGTSETDYALEGEKGRIETALSALWPYGRWTFANGLELRGLAGAGRGTARHVPEGDAPRETGRLTMRAGSLGVRQAFAPLDGFDLAARADASFARMETAKGEEAVDGLRADSWRLRGGLEASKRFALPDGAALSPFAELAARRDGGDGPAGSGIELAGGLRYAAAGVSVEARGRWLAAHSEKGVRERGLSAAVRLDPEAGGRGLSMSLTPRWGAQAGGAGALWREDAPQSSGASEDNAAALDARLGYGFALAPGAGGLLTPFAEAGLAGGDDRRLRLGTRFEARGGALALELAGERRESASARPEHIVGLELRVGF